MVCARYDGASEVVDGALALMADLLVDRGSIDSGVEYFG